MQPDYPGQFVPCQTDLPPRVDARPDFPCLPETGRTEPLQPDYPFLPDPCRTYPCNPTFRTSPIRVWPTVHLDTRRTYPWQADATVLASAYRANTTYLARSMHPALTIRAYPSRDDETN